MAQAEPDRGNRLDVRVEQDLARGDFGMARTRLLSHLQQQGYSAGLLSRIGRISFDMHDLFNAGRYWLLSDAQGAEVDAAIAAFADRCGGIAGNMVAQLPQAFRKKPMASYPPPVQVRLRRLGVTEQHLKAGPDKAALFGTGSTNSMWVNWAGLVLLAGAVLFSIVSLAVGAYTVVRWFF